MDTIMNPQMNLPNARGRGKHLKRSDSDENEDFLSKHCPSPPPPFEFSVKLLDTLDVTNVKNVANGLRSLCVSRTSLVGLCNFIYNFAVESEKNACFGALLCLELRDVNVGDDVRFQSMLIEKLRDDHRQFQKMKPPSPPNNNDGLLGKVSFACEIFRRSVGKDGGGGADFVFLSQVIADYFLILIQRSLPEDLRVFGKYFLMVAKDERFDCLPAVIHGIRKKIISSTSSGETRDALLQLWEQCFEEKSLIPKMYAAGEVV